MENILNKSAELFDLLTVRLKKVEADRDINAQTKSILDAQKFDQDAREEILVGREKNISSLEYANKTAKEIQDELNLITDEKSRLRDKELQIQAQADKKLNEANDILATAKKAQQDVSERELALSNEKKTYRQNVLDDIQKDLADPARGRIKK